MINIKEVLDFEYDRWDLGKCSIRHYLLELLRTVWTEEEGFSGKRPFGNSGWQWDVYSALVSGEFIEGELDSDGFLDSFDKEEAEKLILNCIAYLENQ